MRADGQGRTGGLGSERHRAADVDGAKAVGGTVGSTCDRGQSELHVQQSYTAQSTNPSKFRGSRSERRTPRSRWGSDSRTQ